MNDNWSSEIAGHQQMPLNKQLLPPDRFLTACPIKYDCRSLFIYLLEMEYIPETKSIETIVQYPEQRDVKNFSDDKKLNDFIDNVKKFAFPYVKTLDGQMTNTHTSLVQFYTFAFTDLNRIRQYGYCRSAQSGQHILCIISYLPWYNVFINILNKISNIINEKETTSLYHFLEALYEYELPDPGNHAQIFSHDGLDQIRFHCPDRRIVPSINENRNLLKFFAFFDLEKLIKIFTALLLERSLLIVSKDLENLTSCSLALEYLLYPLEWLHTFVPIMPEHIDLHVFNQPFPFVYGIHTCIYEKLNKSQLENPVILLVDERQVLNGDRDHLPDNIVNHLAKKLKYFQEASADSTTSMDHYSSSKMGLNIEKYDLLRTGPIKAFLDSVLMIIDDYREYLLYDFNKDEYQLNENIYFQMKNVSNESNNVNNGNIFTSTHAPKYISNENEFYHEFRITQAFEEFCRDRCDYLKQEKECILNNRPFQKDFIDSLIEQYKSDNPKLPKLIDKGLKNFEKIRNRAKEKSIVKKLFNTTPSSASKRSSATSAATNSKSTTKIMVSNSLDLNDDKKIAATSTSSSNKVSKAKVNLKFINENVNQIVGSGGGELDDHYTSVSSSSSSTTSINKINNENNLSNFRRLTSVDDSNKRMAIDLSNDPDLRKYFDNNDVNNEENSSHDNNNATVFNLIDISEPTTTTDSINTNSPSSSQLNNKNEDENPFGMDRFIDQIIIETKPASPVPVVSNTATHVHPQTTSNMILSPTSVPKKETPSKPATYKSIIDEFDPIASKLDDLSISSTNNQPTPAASTTANTTTPALLAASKPYMSKPLLPNSYQNLTARPFNSNNNFSLNQTRPNYNIHIPSSTSVQSFSNHHATPIKPATQPIISSSQSFTNNTNLNKTNFINPFCPTPYHAFNINNHEQTYRPVQFMNSNLNKMTTPSPNLFMQPSTSSSLQQQQQQQQTQNNNTNSNKTTADQLLN